MGGTRYIVLREHASEYPEPIAFAKGTSLIVGERYEGPEEWSDWVFCEAEGQQGGWVPAQIIEISGDNKARAREDYTAREMDVKVGEIVFGMRILNGWVWCENPSRGESGWVPLQNLEARGP
jgi:hypothetical protein